MRLAVGLVSLCLGVVSQCDAKAVREYFVAENIKQNLREFTTKPHVAGTPANREVAARIASKWNDYGLEDVHFDSYDVLLSYPDYSTPNRIRLFDQKATKVIYESSGVSPVVFPDEQGASGAGIQWLAYAAEGTVKGSPVYCNYGSAQDFAQLNATGISLEGRIAVIRYGTLFRADKIRMAYERGAVGAILYSDPQDCAPEGTAPENVYPNTVYMPPHGAQRGTLKGMDGDPLTPFFPARRDLFSGLTVDEVRASGELPSIPVLPLPYADAQEILRRMQGTVVPQRWRGGLNLTYHYGPGLENDGLLEIEVHSTMKKVPINNVVGRIVGEEEPDRYVLVGNHFDAWVYGSIDPNSGSAIMSEMARSMAAAKKDGWKPRRSIVFVAWDGEEHGLVGSGEFVEAFAHKLAQRAVAYLNVDLISGNGTLDVRSIPTMYDAIIRAAQKTPNPVQSEAAAGRPTVYDTWRTQMSGPMVADRPNIPRMKTPGGGSDHARFSMYLGIPVADISYIRADRNPKTNDTYPLYHTLYETPFVNEHLFDHDAFSVHKATGQFWAELARDFAEAEILPLNATLFAHHFLDNYVRKLKQTVMVLEPKFDGMNITVQQVNHLIRASQDFIRAAENFHAQLDDHKDKQWKPLELRAINDKLMLVDRCFVSPLGVPGSPDKRNILFSNSATNTYAGNVMPGIYDQVSELEKYQRSRRDGSDIPIRQRIIRRLTEQISEVQYGVQCAINSLSDDF